MERWMRMVTRWDDEDPRCTRCAQMARGAQQLLSAAYNSDLGVLASEVDRSTLDQSKTSLRRVACSHSSQRRAAWQHRILAPPMLPSQRRSERERGEMVQQRAAAEKGVSL